MGSWQRQQAAWETAQPDPKQAARAAPAPATLARVARQGKRNTAKGGSQD